MTPAASARYEVTFSEAARREHQEDDVIHPESAGLLDLTAFVSCYNEAAFIVRTLDDVCEALGRLELRFEIVVIDDCSSDGSAELVRRYIQAHPDIRIVLRRNLVNKGLAQNYIDGAFIGKGRYYKLFCGDNTEPVESIVEICRHIGEADMIIPNYISVEGKSRLRQWLSRAYTAVVNVVSGNRMTYYNGLPLHLRYNVMRWHPNTRGFGFQADIVCMLLDSGATHLEVSVPAMNRAESRALTVKNFLSVGHTLADIAIRRIASWFYGR